MSKIGKRVDVEDLAAFSDAFNRHDADALMSFMTEDCVFETAGGHLYIAHKPKMMRKLEAESKLLNEVFHYNTRILDRETLHREYVGDAEAAGARHEPDGIGIHAGKLAFGYLRMARRLGAKVHPSSPVMGWETRNGVHHLITPGGTVRARSVALATAGYTPPGLHRRTKNRLMPILSNSIVTRPLTADEKAACEFKTHFVLTDTRTLRHYYRQLPDGRVQIGSRSAVTGADAENPKHLHLLQEGLYRKFPALRGIALEYSWWGWVDVSHDMMPRIFQPDPAQKIFYAMGYGGNGVMYSAQAGRRMAQMVAARARPWTCRFSPHPCLATYSRPSAGSGSVCSISGTI